MGEDGNTKRVRITATRRRWLVRGLSLARVLVGGVGYLRKIELHAEPLRLPLQQLVVSSARTDTDTIPPAASIRELEELASDHPDFAPLHGFLASLYRQENRLDDAERAREQLERAIRSATP